MKNKVGRPRKPKLEIPEVDGRVKLSNEERETIITFDQTTEPASIFTYSPRWQKHLEGRLGLKPVLDNGYGGKEYIVPKNRIGMPRAPLKLSVEQREVIGKRLAKSLGRK